MSHQLRTSQPLCSSVVASAVMFAVPPRPVGPPGASSHEPGREGDGAGGELRTSFLEAGGAVRAVLCESLVTLFVEAPPPPPTPPSLVLLFMLCRSVVLVVAGGRA